MATPRRLPAVLLWLVLAFAATTLSARSTAAEDQRFDAEMAMLAAQPEVARALALIDVLEHRSQAALIELNEIPAPPFGEAARARRFAEMIRAAGLDDVSLDAEGNVLARLRGKGGGHTVAVAAHLDTVFPAGTDVRVKREGDRLVAPGISDNARGLVLLLILIETLTATGLETQGDVLFVGTVGEEGLGDLRGVKHLFRADGPRIDEFIAIDSGDDTRVSVEAIGSMRYRVVFRGPGGHSWGAFGLANPAHALASAIHLFEARAAEFVTGKDARATFNIGRIGGGTSVNSIPFEAWAEVDLRSGDPVRLGAIDALLRSAASSALDDHNTRRQLGAPLELELEMIGSRPSGRVDPATPLVQRALAAARHEGLEPVLGVGSTDANVPIALGVPAVTISRGGVSGGAHALNEWWAAEQTARGSRKTLLLVLASAGLDVNMETLRH